MQPLKQAVFFAAFDSAVNAELNALTSRARAAPPLLGGEGGVRAVHFSSTTMKKMRESPLAIRPHHQKKARLSCESRACVQNQIETADYAALTSPAGVVPVPDATLVVTFGLGTTFDAPLDVVGSGTITRAAVYSL